VRARACARARLRVCARACARVRVPEAGGVAPPAKLKELGTPPHCQRPEAKRRCPEVAVGSQGRGHEGRSSGGCGGCSGGLWARTTGV